MKFTTRQWILIFFTIVLIACNKNKENPKVQNAVVNNTYQLNVPFYFGSYKIPADNPLTDSGVALGRRLFYEKKLSADNTMSCGSCHKQKFGFADPNQFSVGIDGIAGTKQSMALANLFWQDKFFWDGRSSSLEEQALLPISDPIELHQSLEAAVGKLQNTTYYPKAFYVVFGDSIINSKNLAKAIAQFERALITSNSKYDLYLKNKYTPTEDELNGLNLFLTHPNPEEGLRGGNCGDCHGGYLTSLRGFHNNGLDTEPDIGLMAVTGNPFDKGKFKTPSLRNIAITAPYMHDGRFSTLEQVLDHYNEHIQTSPTLDPLIIGASNEKNGKSLKLTNKEKADIILFLKMLTDSTFINDKRFSDPFIN